MKKLCILIFCIFMVGACMAQKKVVQPVLDVDRLYQLYKNKSQVTIHRGNKEITANVVINYNGLNQPCAIILYGEMDANANSSLEDLKSELEDAKLKAGYRRMADLDEMVSFEQNSTYENNIRVSLFEKGTQYARYGIRKAEEREPEGVPAADDTAITAPKYVTDFFYFEVGDTARKQAAKNEKLEF